jgi:hypothetical protein
MKFLVRRKMEPQYLNNYEDADYSAIYKPGRRYRDASHRNDPFNGVIPSDQAYKSIQTIAAQNLAPSEIQWHEKFIKKYDARQGGVFSKQEIVDTFKGYYDFDTEPDLQEVKRYLDLITPLLNTFLRYKTDGDLLIDTARELWNTFDPSHPSSGGFTADEDRRQTHVRVKGIKCCMRAPLNLDPIIAGIRAKDGKLRGINMDSMANYFREARVFHKLFELWKENTYNHKYSDPGLAGYIASYAAAAAYAGDFRAMDKHYYKEVFKMVVLKIASIVAPNHSKKWEHDVCAVIDGFYGAHLIVADELWYGLCALLSGLYPTHDPESMLNFIIALCTGTELGLRFTDKPHKLAKNEFTVVVNGDDMILLLGQADPNLIDDISYVHYRISKVFGQDLELSKMDCGMRYIGFCKRTWALRLHTPDFKIEKDPLTQVEYPVPKYAASKAVHALREPEYLPDFPTKSDLCFWAGAILDNCHGTRQWKAVVNAVIQCNTELWIQAITEGPSPECDEILNKDFKYWDHRWESSTSPTILYAKALLKL